MSYRLSNVIERVKFAREAGAVRRCHTMKIIGEYDVAQHSFNMVCMLRVLHSSPSLQLVWACIGHDIPERLTGDIPATAKWFGLVNSHELEDTELSILRMSGFDYQLTEEEKSWLLALDITELYLWTQDQISMGNSNAQKMRDRIERWMTSNSHKIPSQVRDFFWEVRVSAWEMMDELGDPS